MNKYCKFKCIQELTNSTSRLASKTTTPLGVKAEALNDSKKKAKEDQKRGRRITNLMIQDIGI